MPNSTQRASRDGKWLRRLCTCIVGGLRWLCTRIYGGPKWLHTRLVGADPDEVIIQPPPEKFNGEQHTDTASTQVFTAAVQIINSERQTVWQRYAAMVVANTFLLNAIIRASPGKQFLFAVCGLVLCVTWFFVTAVPWYYYDAMVKQAAKFRWAGYPTNINPLSEGTVLPRHFKWGGVLKFFSFAAIVPFMIVYGSYIF